ncbi:hypothetical protein MWU76_10945 [Gelidibacter sp. F2691]|nr:hypothetical protein [Gelidibacter sp. F2691]
MFLIINLVFTILSFNGTIAEPITATVIFENFTNQSTVHGILYITETNQQIKMNTLDSFNVELPKEGRYEFRFHSEDATTFTSYPSKITKKNNVITIRLMKKPEGEKNNFILASGTTKDISKLSPDDIKREITAGRVNFIIHGLVAINPDNFQAFKKEYGIGFLSENCVIDPLTHKTSQDNNKAIAAYLTSLYGKDWELKLPAQPFGL